MAKYFFPTWKGWLLINPIRNFFQPPFKIIGDSAKLGMRVLDLGCSMGFFSLPLAEMVGENGYVLCLDSDDRQLEILRRRAARRNLMGRMEIRRVSGSSDDLTLNKQSFDLAVLMQVLHYMDDPTSALSQVHASIKTGASLLVGEPKSHLSEQDWQTTLRMVEQSGFEIIEQKAMYNLRLAKAKK